MRCRLHGTCVRDAVRGDTPDQTTIALGDLFGRKRLGQISVLIFLVGSGLCAVSETMTMVEISSVLQGIGAGAICIAASALVGARCWSNAPGTMTWTICPGQAASQPEPGFGAGG